MAQRVRLIHERLANRKLILGIGRLDYTKGIPERLESFELLIEKYPQIQGKVTLVQIALPSRVHVPEYRLMKESIDRVIGRINGRYTRDGWIPIEYIYRTLDRSELVSYYRASQIALITPLKDGMNIVAKEYCASCVENKGVLILSEFAGAALALGKAALLVNPYNVEDVADRIFESFQMGRNEQRRRMSQLRREVRAPGFDIRQRGRAVYTGLTLAEEIQIRAIEKQQTGHSRRPPSPTVGRTIGTEL